MYSKSNNKATFFTSKLENSEKVTNGRVSVPVNTGRKDKDGKDIWAYESWNARFVGKAREKALALTDKAKITLTEWASHPGYDKEKKQCYPYLMVMDFEVREQGTAAVPEMSENDYMVMEDEDAQLPF